VTILPLPGLPKKGDVSDWLASGGTKEQLLELAEQARGKPHERNGHAEHGPQIAADRGPGGWGARRKGAVPFSNGLQPPPPNTDDDKKEAEGPPAEEHLTDLGNAGRMIRRHGQDLRYCQPWRKWVCWTGSRWRIDDTLVATCCAKSVAAELFGWAQREIAEVAESVKGDADE
jgi:putative DNA primase/helicase